MSVTFIRQSGGDLIRINSLPNGYGQFQFSPYSTPYGNIMSLNGAWAVENGVGTQLCPTNFTLWEAVFKLGAGGAPASSFDFVGLGHGHEEMTSVYIAWRNGTGAFTDITNCAVGFSVTCDEVIYVHSANIHLPSTGELAGTLQRYRSATDGGLLVRTDLHPTDGQYEWYTLYAAMLPLYHLSGSTGFDQVQFGTGAQQPILSPSPAVAKSAGSQVSEILASHTGHPYGIRVSFPNGSPSGSWASALPDCAWWLDQQSSGAAASKLYVNDISSDYTKRKTTFARQVITKYEIVRP